MRTKLSYYKPLYLGFSVLELSKILMHDFLYDYVKPIYSKNNCIVYCIHKNRYLQRYCRRCWNKIFDGKIITKIVRLRAKTYSYLIDDGSEH